MKNPKKKKFLVETSAVHGLLNLGSDAHRADLQQRLAEGETYGSVYIRNETIAAFVCDFIGFAELVDQSPTVSDACTWWSDMFGRKPKALGGINATVLRQCITVNDSETHSAAVEIAQIAYDLLDRFDIIFEKLAPNAVGCLRGKMKPNVDGSRLLDDMHDFRLAFLKDVPNCPINDFLQFGSKHGRAAKLVGCPNLQTTKKIRGVINPLGELVKASTAITCSDCRLIGDPVIALEQPKSLKLIHVDHSFDKLCACTGCQHELVPSNLSFAPKISKSPAGPNPGEV